MTRRGVRVLVTLLQHAVMLGLGLLFGALWRGGWLHQLSGTLAWAALGLGLWLAVGALARRALLGRWPGVAMGEGTHGMLLALPFCGPGAWLLYLHMLREERKYAPRDRL